MSEQKQHQTVYIGTYTENLPFVQGKGEGIYSYRFDLATGELTRISQAGGIRNPSYLILDSKQEHLYAVQETNDDDDAAVYALALDSKTATFQHLNRQPAHGGLPCHLTLDPSERFVLIANYLTGSVAVYPVAEDGGLGEATSVIQHEGASVNADRQLGPHAHSVTFGPDGLLFVADLGIDKLMIYRLDSENGSLSPADPPNVELHPGAGPRHFKFHPCGKFAFANGELDATVTVFSYEQGNLTPLQSLSTLPDGSDAHLSTAAIRVHPSGRFVYVSNRGHDSIAAFEFDEASGKLNAIGHTSTQGKNPRDFEIDPSGAFLLAGNQDSGTVVTFRIDAITGELSPTGHTADVPNPVCILPVWPVTR